MVDFVVRIWIYCVQCMQIHRHVVFGGNLIIRVRVSRWGRSVFTRMDRVVYWNIYQYRIRIMERCRVGRQMKLANSRCRVCISWCWQVWFFGWFLTLFCYISNNVIMWAIRDIMEIKRQTMLYSNRISMQIQKISPYFSINSF